MTRKIGDEASHILWQRVRAKSKDQYGFIAKLAFVVVLTTVGGVLALSSFWPTRIAGVFVLGATYTHAVELQHQCLHHSAFIRSQWHRIVGVPLGIPLFVGYSHYRIRHLQHHKHLGTPEDSEFFGFDARQPITWGALFSESFNFRRLLIVLGDIVRSVHGSWVYDMGDISERRRREAMNEYRLMGACVLVAVGASVVGFGEQVLLLWVLPLLIAVPLHFIVELPEHILCDNSSTDVLRNTRTITGSRFSTWFTNGNNLHVEHHAAMSVPINRLPERHAVARELATHTARSYPEFFRLVVREAQRNRNPVVTRRAGRIRRSAPAGHPAVPRMRPGPNTSQPPSRTYLARAHDRHTLARTKPSGAATIVLLFLVALAGWSLYSLQPPESETASAPQRDFSAARAMTDAKVVAKTAHSMGSPGAAAVREHLTERLTALGGTVRGETDTVAVNGEGTAKVGEVSNVVARFEGAEPTGTVLLVAHYDSVPAGPGASDNGVNVAAILEVVRALKEGGTPRNNVEVLLTDGEEAGLLGAHDFVSKKAADPKRTVVLNLEARGVTGPSIMFESGPGNSSVLPALGSTSSPVGTSLADEVYRLMSNHTDFTEFKEAGFPGLNYAFVDGSARYHTAGDAIANVSTSSLQHQGESVLAAARTLSSAGLDALGDGEEHTYFTFLGVLVHYPQSLVPALAGLALLAFGATVWYARRTGALYGGSIKGAFGFLGALAVSWFTGFCLWSLAVLVRPEYGNLLMGDTYRPQWYRAAFIVFGCAAVLGWYLLLRRRVPVLGLALGVWGWFALLALLTAVLAPGASYLFSWPLLIGCLALTAALRWGGQDEGWYAVAASVAALPALVLFIPVIVLIMPTLGVAAAPIPLLLIAFVMGLLVPLTGVLPRRVPGLTGLVAVVTGTALLLTGMAVDDFGPDRPGHTSLAYLWDAGRGTGTWASSDEAPPAWARESAGRERGPVSDDFPTYPPISPNAVHAPARGPAPAAPEVSVDADPASGGGERTVRLKVKPASGTSYLTLMADITGHRIEKADLLGVTVKGGVNRPYPEGPWKWGFVLWSLPEEGVEITLRVSGKGKVPLRLTGYNEGLPDSARLSEKPSSLTWSTHGDALTNVTAVGRGIRA